MRKMTALCICLGLLFLLAGCGGAADKAVSAETSPAIQQEEPSAAPEQPNSGPPETEQETRSDPIEINQEDTEKNTILVAYFSATGTTEQMALQIAEILRADLYEIVPEEPYTESDLAYYTGGRADQEQEDPDARPAISGSVADMEQYDTILLGYPIWHGQAPRIISTFLESYELAGKTILPFCTSHSSGVGSSAEDLHDLCPDTVTWADGTRFAGGTSGAEMESWLQNHGLAGRGNS